MSSQWGPEPEPETRIPFISHPEPEPRRVSPHHLPGAGIIREGRGGMTYVELNKRGWEERERLREEERRARTGVVRRSPSETMPETMPEPMPEPEPESELLPGAGRKMGRRALREPDPTHVSVVTTHERRIAPRSPPRTARGAAATGYAETRGTSDGQEVILNINGKMVALTLKLSNTVGQVKAMIQRKMGIPVDEQILKWSGIHLNNDNKFEEYNMTLSDLYNITVQRAT